jgi:hypothetical protein
MDMITSVAAEIEPVPQLQEDKPVDYPVAIFGRLPDGFVLEEQSIYLLNIWHRKASEMLAAYEESDGADEGSEECAQFECVDGLRQKIFEASFLTTLRNSGEIAALLEIIVRHLRSRGDENCEGLDIFELQRIQKQLDDFTRLFPPKKHVGMPHRGRKLTRAGLLFRYESFLMKELQTLSLNLYGDRDYALQYILEDDAVNLHCRDSRHKYPFFDESKLADRAKSVLKSLKIDTKKFDVLGSYSVTWVTSEAWPGR